MVEHVWRRLQQADLEEVIVATDDERIARVVDGFGGVVVRTGACETGTDRVREAVSDRLADVVVNVQVDVPLVDPAHIDLLTKSILRGADIATLSVVWDSEADRSDPNLVKVVADARGRGLFFSRQPIPHRGPWWRHIGIYAFSGPVLSELPRVRSSLEVSEDLEQLRWLEAGLHVAVIRVAHAPSSVDTPEQLEGLQRRFSAVGPIVGSAN